MDVSGRGYKPGRSWNNEEDLASQNRAGGAHGGIGSPGYTSWGIPGQAYGDLTDPNTPGAGPGTQNAGGSDQGGGVARLRVRDGGHLVINGCVRADGDNHSSNGGGGAGGSIRIDTPHLSGTGTISAIGGTGRSNNDHRAGGGGGGRVAIVGYTSTLDAFAPEVITDAVSVRGGTGYDKEGGSGTLFLRGVDDTYGSLIVNNEDYECHEGSTPLIAVPGGTTDEVGANTLEDFGSVFLTNYYVGTRVRGRVEQGSVPTLTDDEHFLIVSNDATSLTIAGAFDASYEPLQTYRGLHVYEHVQIMGGARIASEGDLLVLEGDRDDSPESFDIDGSLNAVVVDLVSVGTITVSGGSLDVEDVVVGGTSEFPLVLGLDEGTVRRPVLYAASIEGTGATIDVDALIADADVDLGESTITADEVHVGGAMSLEDVTMNAGTVSVTGTLSITGTSTVEIEADSLNVGEHVQIGDGTYESVLTHSDCQGDTVHRLMVTAHSMTIHEGSSINVNGRGYEGDKGAGTHGAGNATETGSASGAGGSYGGVGGGNSGVVYGLYFDPTEPGAGGARHDGGHPGGDGGGLVDLRITSFLTVHGGIYADGSSSHGSSGGSGGAIRIEATHVAGAGVLSVRGANGSSPYSHQSAGGGGRIAVLDWTTATDTFDPVEDSPQLILQGGTGYHNGGSGTFFSRANGSSWGSLVVDNEGVSTNPDSTPLVGPGQGSVDVVEASALIDYDSQWLPSGLVGS
ncbi:MAG: hypothetical protein QF464_10205, partial [Myxococcota bacterium]|nr:hypothetical protein [Myxococcota bacterium]